MNRPRMLRRARDSLQFTRVVNTLTIHQANPGSRTWLRTQEANGCIEDRWWCRCRRVYRTIYGVSVIWTRRSFPGPPDTVRTRFHSRTW